LIGSLLEEPRDQRSQEGDRADLLVVLARDARLAGNGAKTREAVRQLRVERLRSAECLGGLLLLTELHLTERDTLPGTDAGRRPLRSVGEEIRGLFEERDGRLRIRGPQPELGRLAKDVRGRLPLAPLAEQLGRTLQEGERIVVGASLPAENGPAAAVDGPLPSVERMAGESAGCLAEAAFGCGRISLPALRVGPQEPGRRLPTHQRLRAVARGIETRKEIEQQLGDGLACRGVRVLVRLQQPVREGEGLQALVRQDVLLPLGWRERHQPGERSGRGGPLLRSLRLELLAAGLHPFPNLRHRAAHHRSSFLGAHSSWRYPAPVESLGGVLAIARSL